MACLQKLRQEIGLQHRRREDEVIDALIDGASPTPAQMDAFDRHALELVHTLRESGNTGLLEVFLAEYGLSNDEGIALMCLAEALPRVSDTQTMDALIEDKIAPSKWGQHLGHSSSSLVNASTWALLLTGTLLQDGVGVAALLKSAVKRLGEPVIRSAVVRVMRELGAQFVLGQTIEEALERGRKNQERGYCYSYDMLGEAAMTAPDAEIYYRAYRDAIDRLSDECKFADIIQNPGISIKLSALHPRYEVAQTARIMKELVPRTLELAQRAKAASMGLNIDAEEVGRLDLSLNVIEAVLRDRSLEGWDGFGVVVQAYGKSAPQIIDWLAALAAELGRKIMVRLVKGAYWDSEIKRAQVDGVPDFPVFTHKTGTDISYICCAKRLLALDQLIYPQFATHNAHSMAAILELAGDKRNFEFQRLYGMGETLHDLVKMRSKARCRIYAPVGTHRDLMAYLVRRLLENGANSSFVHRIIDRSVPAVQIAANPFKKYEADKKGAKSAAIIMPGVLYGSERKNSRGWDLQDFDDLEDIERARNPFRHHRWEAAPVIVGARLGAGRVSVTNPADPNDQIGMVSLASPEDVTRAIGSAAPWSVDAPSRAKILCRAADLYEKNYGEIFAALTREAGKTQGDAVSELREAVDFLRYYSVRAGELTKPPCGIIACISPWNFPLAIFTGQIAAALAAGNGVLAKPAAPTVIIASIAVRLLHEAGVPVASLQLLPGKASIVGAGLTSDPHIKGVCFTGSIDTAHKINRVMADKLSPDASLIAETGGINAMIVDSTTLLERSVADILISAFQSAGQRCSALRILYIQEDIRERLLNMLCGAMDELVVGNPWAFHTDIGPIINQDSCKKIGAYIDKARAQGRLLKEISVPRRGNFLSPAILQVDGIGDMGEEIFGPVLHVASFQSSELDRVVDEINKAGFGLTFGMHSRIDERIERVTSRLNIGNIYINRNQIGAIVGSQPFGGEGLSGTGPKAGGLFYVERFTKAMSPRYKPAEGGKASACEIRRILEMTARPKRTPLRRIEMPGPTGESNMLYVFARGKILCLGPTRLAAARQAEIAREYGCSAIIVAPGAAGENAIDGKIDFPQLCQLDGFDAVAYWAEERELRLARKALAARAGPLIPLLTEEAFGPYCWLERHICVDTTASGGNAALLAQTS